MKYAFLFSILLSALTASAISISGGSDIPEKKDGQVAAVCDGNCYTSLASTSMDQCHGKKAGDLHDCAAKHLGNQGAEKENSGNAKEENK